jgi:hypothetical protein
VRKARTEALFEAMQKNIEALREYANHLESQLEKCCREHGGSMDLRLRPNDDSDAMGVIEDMADYSTEQNEETGVDSDPENDPTVKELCIPTRNLNVRLYLPLEG